MTTPYVTGTVSVTAGSAVVTGVGTGWLTSGLVAGQFGLDSANGNPVPVLSIDSDTQITLAKPWRGTSAGAQGYWITYDTMPGQQTVANAQRLAEYIARLDKPALAALASLVPAVDKLPYFGAGGAGALADFNAAARALLAGTGILPNSQLPASQTGKTFTSLSTMTGLNNNGSLFINTAGSTLSFQRNNADSVDIEAFLQGGGAKHRIDLNRYGGGVTINGRAVFERGSNANGEYVRFGDGTQICFGFLSLSYFNGTDLTGTKSFPASFSANPGVSITPTLIWPSGTVRSVPMWARQNGIAPSQLNASATNPSGNNQPGDTFQVVYTAIGRWF